MDEYTLQALSRALTHLIFRNGVVEDLHAEGVCLDDKTMKRLNCDINNRVYTLLIIWFNGIGEEIDSLERTLNFLEKYYGLNWKPAKYVDLLIR